MPLKTSKASAGNWHIVMGSAADAANDSAVRLVAGGRGSMSVVLGDAAVRYNLFHKTLQWDRVVLAYCSDVAVGFAAFKHKGRGPYAPTWSDFRREFGMLSAYWRYAFFLVTEWRDRRAEFYLYGLKVVPTHRRRGIARALIDAVEEAAQSVGAISVDLEVSEDNAAALKLYERRGYRRVKVLQLGWFKRFFSFSRLYLMRHVLR